MSKVDYTKMTELELLNACGDDASKWAAAFVQYYAVANQGKDMPAEGWMIGWFANAIERACDVRRWNNKQLSGSEAVFGFAAWLTTRKDTTTMGAAHNCSPIVDLIGKFCDVNHLTPPREHWSELLTHPSEE